MAQKLTRLVVAAAIAAVAVFAAGCGDDDNGSAADDGGGGGDLTAVSLVVPNPSVIAMYPFFVAQDQGYFEEEGLDVTINAVDGTGPSLTALASGTTDLVQAPTLAVLPAAAEGQFSPVMFFRDFVGSPIAVAAPPDAGISTPADMEGKRIGVSALSGIETLVTQNLARTADLDPENDLEIVPVGDGGQAAVALEREEVDAFAGGIADIAIVQARGLEMELVPPPAGRSPMTHAVWTTKEYAEANPEVLEGFSRAAAKALEYVGEDVDGLVEIATELSPEQTSEPEVTEALAETSVALHQPADGVPYGHIDGEEFQGWFDVANQDGALDGLDPKGLFTNEYNGTGEGR